MWKRKTLDPPSYIDLEKANKPSEKGRTTEPGEKSPELPIQPAEKSSLQEEDNPLEDSGPYVPCNSREPWVEQKRGRSRNGSNASSITLNESAYNSYWETLQKRAQFTSSVVSTDGTFRDSGSDHGSKDPGHTGSGSRGKSVGSVWSVYSDTSQYSQTSERIFIDNVRMPPQFSTPTRPSSAVS